MVKHFYSPKTLILVLLAALAIACGGGGDSSGGGAGAGGGNNGGGGGPSNAAPVAEAGENASVAGGVTVVLDASASSDDKAIASHTWRQVSGVSVDLNSSTAARVEFISPAVQQESALVFEVSVSDAEGLSATDTVTITVMPDSGNVLGLDMRPSNTSCVAGPAPSSDAAFLPSRVFENLSFNKPLWAMQRKGDDSRWYVLEQEGRLLSFANQADVSTTQTMLDIRARVDDSARTRESGLLSFAFHPGFPELPFVYAYFQVSKNPQNGDDCCRSRLARFTSNDGGQTFDPNSEKVLFELDWPFENHFGGHLLFGDDGYLYLSLGDGGSGGDPGDRAQDLSTPLGKMLRLDINNGDPYAIPSDNPFDGDKDVLCDDDAAVALKKNNNQACPEIYALGLRNPWRWSFDEATGDMWLADVGQDLWEEVNIIQRGGNYGWNIREGAHCFKPSSNCPTAGLIDPVAEIRQTEFESITGGLVYRGTEIPELVGQYIFGDYVNRQIYTLSDKEDGSKQLNKLISDSGLNIAAFTQDNAGEAYVVSYGGGLYKLIDNGSSSSENQVPEKLSETGCVMENDPKQPAAGLIPYTINAPFWSDGASKQRWMAIPDGSTISEADGDWEFPVGAVLVKNFKLNNKLIETRLLKHHDEGSWTGATYAWNAAETEANLVRGGRTEVREGQVWEYPSEGQCLRCHTGAAGRALGPETQQLNRSNFYASTGRIADQLQTLQEIGLVEALVQPFAKLSDPADDTQDLGDRARAYLHTNCAQCHQPDTTVNLNMDLRASASLADMQICNIDAENGDLGVADAKRLAPGDAQKSVLWLRMGLRDDASQMPPIGSHQVDEMGQSLLQAWINSLVTCP